MENNIKLVNTVEDLKDLKHNTLIKYTCRNCGKLVQRQYRTSRKNTIVNFLCKYCYREYSYMNKYGVKHQMHLKSVKDKMAQTMLDKYGVKYTRHSKELIEKCKESLNKHYGVDNPMKSKEIQEKAKRTMIDRYNVPYSGLSKELFEKTKETKKRLYGNEHYVNLEKAKETILRKYGIDHQWKSPEIREKIKQTFNRKYGVDYPMQANSVKDKAKTSFLNKYGVENPLKHPDVIKRIISSRGRKYSYYGVQFDSSWELALWIYAKDHNEPIERVEEPLTYTINGKIHFYFPDFRYKGELIEIKGSQFMNNGSMVNPYDPSQDELFAAKQRCALENNVRFMFEKDIQFAIDYASNKYGDGNNWYNQFITNPLPPLQLTPPPLMMMPMYIYPTIPMVLPWWMFMTPCDFHPYTTTNVFEREGMEFVDCECEYECA